MFVDCVCVCGLMLFGFACCLVCLVGYSMMLLLRYFGCLTLLVVLFCIWLRCVLALWLP